jgi:hypothetical protein
VKSSASYFCFLKKSFMNRFLVLIVYNSTFLFYNSSRDVGGGASGITMVSLTILNHGAFITQTLAKDHGSALSSR